MRKLRLIATQARRTRKSTSWKIASVWRDDLMKFTWLLSTFESYSIILLLDAIKFFFLQDIFEYSYIKNSIKSNYMKRDYVKPV